MCDNEELSRKVIYENRYKGKRREEQKAENRSIFYLGPSPLVQFNNSRTFELVWSKSYFIISDKVMA
jgi:hypothetical protein